MHKSFTKSFTRHDMEEAEKIWNRYLSYRFSKERYHRRLMTLQEANEYEESLRVGKARKIFSEYIQCRTAIVPVGFGNLYADYSRAEVMFFTQLTWHR